MTGRTHDLFAFTALNFTFVTQNIPRMTFSTAAVAFGANMIGGLLPDIDNATADIWKKVRFGKIFSRIIKPLIGGHRLISHSVLGMAITGFILRRILDAASATLLVDMEIVWWAFMIGYLSHLIADSFTSEGVPWLFPLPVRIGFPPHRRMRIKTGGFAEKALVFPGLVAANGYLVYTNYGLYLNFFRQFAG